MIEKERDGYKKQPQIIHPKGPYFSVYAFEKEIYKNADEQYASDTKNKTNSEIRHLIDDMSLFTAEEEASRENERERMRKDSSRFYGDEFTKLGEETRLKKAELVEMANQLKAHLPSLKTPIFTSVKSPPIVPKRSSPPSRPSGNEPSINQVNQKMELPAHSGPAPATPPRKHTPPPQRPVKQGSPKITSSAPGKDELAGVAAHKTFGEVAKKAVVDVVQATVEKVVNIQQGVNDALKASQGIRENPPNISKTAENLLDEKYGKHRFFRESIESDDDIQQEGATKKTQLKEALDEEYGQDVMSEFDKMMKQIDEAADNASGDESDFTPKT